MARFERRMCANAERARVFVLKIVRKGINFERQKNVNKDSVQMQIDRINCNEDKEKEKCKDFNQQTLQTEESRLFPCDLHERRQPQQDVEADNRARVSTAVIVLQIVQESESQQNERNR